MTILAQKFDTNLFEPSVAFDIETSHIVFETNRMIVFYKYATLCWNGLKFKLVTVLKFKASLKQGSHNISGGQLHVQD